MRLSFLLFCGFLLTLLPRLTLAQPTLATSPTHTLAVHADGSLWAWGSNRFGQLGTSSATDQLTPVQVGTAYDWASVAAGTHFSLAVRRDGTLWSWGMNYNGQLGQGFSSASRPQPTQVGTAHDWTSVAAGPNFVLGLRRDGTLWAWGANFDGQLGDGTTTQRLQPVPVGGSSRWRSGTVGEYHTVAIRQDGTLWTWGGNGNGQLGLGTHSGTGPGTAPSPQPSQVGTAHDWTTATADWGCTVATRADGSVWAWGRGHFGQGNLVDIHDSPVRINLPVPVRSVAILSNSMIALACDGTLWGWGAGYHGTFADASSADRPYPEPLVPGMRWTQLVGSNRHAIARRPNGSVWAWGDNEAGEIGHASLTGKGTLTWRQEATDQRSWTALATGTMHTVALQRDGSLWAWGQNTYGTLGNGTTLDGRLPARVGTATDWTHVYAGYAHTLALRRDGSLWAWGNNDGGQLGDGTRQHRTTPQRVAAGSAWTSVAAGWQHTAAIRPDGTLWTWGTNTDGQLGHGTVAAAAVPTQVGTATGWRSVAAGWHHTLALRHDGTLWAWGANNRGQLGDGTTTPRLAPVQVGTGQDWMAVAVGDEHSLALRRDGTLWTWGSNMTWQLGQGVSTWEVLSPTQVGTDTDWQHVGGGAFYSVGVRRNGSLWTWGWNVGSNWNWPDTPSPTPQPMAPGHTWSSVATGWAHVVGLRQDTTLWGWGSNATGALGTPSYTAEPLLIQPGNGRSNDPERLAVYPNPARGKTTVVSTNCSTPLHLYDAAGRLLRQLPSCATTLVLDGLPTGLYLLRQGSSSTRLLVQ